MSVNESLSEPSQGTSRCLNRERRRMRRENETGHFRSKEVRGVKLKTKELKCSTDLTEGNERIFTGYPLINHINLPRKQN